jgi:hypothetical protein
MHGATATRAAGTIRVSQLDHAFADKRQAFHAPIPVSIPVPIPVVK